jgi:hypothetical protein
MKTADRVDGELRCPACSRLLVLRSGPKVAAHYAHRPRQSCRNRSGRTGRAPLRLEQLTLFELPPVEPRPVDLPPVEPPPVDWAPVEWPPAEPGRISAPAKPFPVRRARRRRRRRRAWLPRLLRWIKEGRGPAPPGLHP